MSNIFYKAFLYSRRLNVRSLPCCSLNGNHLFSVRFLSTSSKDSSFTISYLINSCGLSPESALKASKYAKFEQPNNPDSVIECLKNQGFSKTQISDVVRRQPCLLTVDPQRYIVPKIEFFMSKGVSRSDVARLFSQYPTILKSRLEEQIIPNFNFLKEILQFDELVISSVRRYLGVLGCNPEASVVPNMKVLQAYGVSEFYIRAFLKKRPRVLVSSPTVFEEAVKEVKAMGFDPSKTLFLEAVAVIRQIKKTTWDRKVEAYKKWGWSEESILQAFRCYPWCMATSEDKINAVMDFVVNKMGWVPLLICKYPQLLNLSLENRIIPRGSVIKVVMSKGLIKNTVSLSSFLSSSESVFVKKYITPFEKELPEILKIYKGNVGHSKT